MHLHNSTNMNFAKEKSQKYRRIRRRKTTWNRVPYSFVYGTITCTVYSKVVTIKPNVPTCRVGASDDWPTRFTLSILVDR